MDWQLFLQGKRALGDEHRERISPETYYRGEILIRFGRER